MDNPTTKHNLTGRPHRKPRQKPQQKPLTTKHCPLKTKKTKAKSKANTQSNKHPITTNSKQTNKTNPTITTRSTTTIQNTNTNVPPLHAEKNAFDYQPTNSILCDPENKIIQRSIISNALDCIYKEPSYDSQNRTQVINKNAISTRKQPTFIKASEQIDNLVDPTYNTEMIYKNGKHIYASLPEGIIQTLAEAAADNHYHVLVLIAERNKSDNYRDKKNTPRSVKHGCRLYWGHNKRLLETWPDFQTKLTNLQQEQQQEIKAHELRMTNYIVQVTDLRYDAYLFEQALRYFKHIHTILELAYKWNTERNPEVYKSKLYNVKSAPISAMRRMLEYETEYIELLSTYFAFDKVALRNIYAKFLTDKGLGTPTPVTPPLYLPINQKRHQR